MLKSVYVLMNYQARTGKRVLNTPRLTCQPATHPTGQAKRSPEASDWTQIGYRLAGRARAPQIIGG